MVDALMPSAGWISHESPLVPGKGVPTFAYLTMRVMKQLGVAPGAIRRLVVCGNDHVESVPQLACGERAGLALEQATCDTTSYLSVETPMIQSMRRVNGVHVQGGKGDRVAALLEWDASGASARRRAIGRDRTLELCAVPARFVMKPDDVVLYDYLTEIDLAPR